MWLALEIWRDNELGRLAQELADDDMLTAEILAQIRLRAID